jgi:16S rRNA (cytosine967-C5)-methyltransferase
MAQPGDRVADLAAAPGGKTMQLIDATGGPGVLALDSSIKRVLRASRRAPEALWVVGDAASPPIKAATMDRVLLDAPCSGLGTLRRRPEIRHRVTAANVTELASLQRRMLEAALGLLKPGGRLVYSVCTVTPQETVDIVRGFGARPPEGLPGRVWGDGLLLAPHITGTDGMFVAVIEPG